MRYRIEIKSQAAKALERIPLPHRRRIAHAIDVLADNPRPDGVRKLVGMDDAHRLRVGDYRVIYEIADQVLTVFVVRIGHRKDIYR